MAAPVLDEAPDFDAISSALESGARARNILSAGAGVDLDRRRTAVWTIAEDELRSGLLTPERAFMHVACANALRRYKDELNNAVNKAQVAADKLRTESEPTDGDDTPRQGD